MQQREPMKIANCCREPAGTGDEDVSRLRRWCGGLRIGDAVRGTGFVTGSQRRPPEGGRYNLNCNKLAGRWRYSNHS